MDILEVHLSKGEVMTKQEAIKIINKVGEDFGWQMGKVGANYENGYMKAIRDVKNAFNHIVDSNKMIVTNADRFFELSEKEICRFVNGFCIERFYDSGRCENFEDCTSCKIAWLKEKVE